MLGWKGEAKWGRCVGKKEQMVPTPLLTTLYNTCYFSLCFLGKMEGLDSTSPQPLCTGEGATEVLKGNCGMLKQFPRLLRTCWALQGPTAALKGPWGAAQDLIPDLPVAQTQGSYWSPHTLEALAGSRAARISNYWNRCHVGTRYY